MPYSPTLLHVHQTISARTWTYPKIESPTRPLPARIPPPVPLSMLREGVCMSGFCDPPLPIECENTKDQESEWRYKPPTFPLMSRKIQISETNDREDV